MSVCVFVYDTTTTATGHRPAINQLVTTTWTWTKKKAKKSIEKYIYKTYPYGVSDRVRVCNFAHIVACIIYDRYMKLMQCTLYIILFYIHLCAQFFANPLINSQPSSGLA